MQPLLIALLFVVLLATVITFAVMGWRQSRRRVRLARAALDLGLRFSVDDPFDILSRYSEFAMISSGHSSAVRNVTFGHLEGWPIRTFDYLYEVGHGTRRTTRRYGMVLLQAPHGLPPLLMWNHTHPGHARTVVADEPDFARIARADADGKIDSWTYIGDSALADSLAKTLPFLAQAGACIQTQGSSILLGLRQTGAKDAWTRILEIVHALRTLTNGRTPSV